MPQLFRLRELGPEIQFAIKQFGVVSLNDKMTDNYLKFKMLYKTFCIILTYKL